jgi:hypothetical protein
MADYRSFIFCTANKTPVCSHSSGSRVLFFWRALSGQAFGFIFFVTPSEVEVPFPSKKDTASILHANPPKIQPKLSK